MRRSPWVGAFLDGVNVASFGLMAAVTWQLGQAALIDPLTIVAALVSLGLLVRYDLNTTWLIAGGAALGLARAFLG
jgi:chromate transporter